MDRNLSQAYISEPLGVVAHFSTEEWLLFHMAGPRQKGELFFAVVPST